MLNGTQTIDNEGDANSNFAGAGERANDRANLVRNQLISRGVAPRISLPIRANALNGDPPWHGRSSSLMRTQPSPCVSDI